MKKLAVIVPPIKDFYYTPHRGAFLGARYVELFFKKHGYRTAFFDFPNKKTKQTDIPRELCYLKKFIIEEETGALSFFKKYKRFGYSFEKCREEIEKFAPDILVLSLFAFAYADEFLEFAHFLKKHFKKSILLCGGAGVSCFPEYFEKSGIFDAILVGEIESLSSFALKAAEGKLKGTVFSEETADNFEFIVAHTLSTKKTNYFSSVLSRGCPKQCSFCSNFIVQKRKFRTVKLSEIEKKINSLSLKKANINFEDDNILFAKDYLIEVLTLIKKRFPDTTFSFENGIDYAFLDGKTVERLIKLGVKQFNLSVGHIDGNLLKKAKRGFFFDKLLETVEILSKYKIPSIIYFISGLKGDSFEKTSNTLLFLHKLPSLTGISPFYPVPGIEGFENREIFLKYPPTLTKGSSFFPWNASLTTEELITAFRIARLSNLIKKENKNENEKNLLKTIRKSKTLHTLTKNGIIKINNLNKNNYIKIVEKLL